MAIASIANLTDSTVAGSNTEIQYNNSGVFGASSNLTFDGSTLTVTGDISQSGNYTNTALPAFSVGLASASNVTGDGTIYTVAYDTEVFDQGSDFNTSTYLFTAPVTGKYQLNATVLASGINSGAGHATVEVTIVTSNRWYGTAIQAGASVPAAGGNISALADMDAADTAYVFFKVDGGTKTVSIAYGVVYTFFTGHLVC